MKLTEIINPKYKDVTPKQPKWFVDDIHDNITSHNDFLGSGSFAKVVQNLKSKYPNQVIKSGTVTKNDNNQVTDAYYQYIKMLHDKDLASKNPYFPRVYSTKLYHENKDNTSSFNIAMYIAVIEKLIPMDSIPVESLIAVGNKMFHNFEDNVKSGYLRNFYTHPNRSARKRRNLNDEDLDNKERSDPMSHSAVAFAISHQLQRALKDSQSMINVKDPLLKQALLFTKKLNQRPDLHDENFMFRLGPGGAQLVLTDPVF